MVIDLIHPDVLFAVCMCWLVAMNWLYFSWESNADSEPVENVYDSQCWDTSVRRDSKGRFMKGWR